MYCYLTSFICIKYSFTSILITINLYCETFNKYLGIVVLIIQDKIIVIIPYNYNMITNIIISYIHPLALRSTPGHTKICHSVHFILNNTKVISFPFLNYGFILICDLIN